MTRKGVQTGYGMGTTLQKKGNQWTLSIQHFDFRNLLGIVNFNILANGNPDLWFKIRVCRETGRRRGSVVERCLNKADTNSTL